MSNSSRPGGLTALAVLNFVFSGIWCIWAMILAIGLFLADKTGLKAEKSIVTIQLLFALIIPTLLVISGIGYLQQKRVMGKILGTVYAFDCFRPCTSERGLHIGFHFLLNLSNFDALSFEHRL